MIGIIRHDFDPDEIAAQCLVKVMEFERCRERFKTDATRVLVNYNQADPRTRDKLWVRPPEGPGYVDPMIDEWIDRERNYYSLAHVIEYPTGEKRFRLVYGDPLTGTGPFSTLEEAKDWYRGGGR